MAALLQDFQQMPTKAAAKRLAQPPYRGGAHLLLVGGHHIPGTGPGQHAPLTGTALILGVGLGQGRECLTLLDALAQLLELRLGLLIGEQVVGLQQDMAGQVLLHHHGLLTPGLQQFDNVNAVVGANGIAHLPHRQLGGDTGKQGGQVGQAAPTEIGGPDARVGGGSAQGGGALLCPGALNQLLRLLHLRGGAFGLKWQQHMAEAVLHVGIELRGMAAQVVLHLAIIDLNAAVDAPLAHLRNGQLFAQVIAKLIEPVTFTLQGAAELRHAKAVLLRHIAQGAV